MYAKIDDNNNVVMFPYSLADFQRDFPNVSVPPNPNPSALAEFNVVDVIEGDKPTITKGQVLDPGFPTFNGVNWVSEWVVLDIDESELLAQQERYVLGARSRSREVTLTGYQPTLTFTPSDETVLQLNTMMIAAIIDDRLGVPIAEDTYPVRDSNKVVHELTRRQLLELYQKLIAYIKQVQRTGWALTRNDLDSPPPFPAGN